MFPLPWLGYAGNGGGGNRTRVVFPPKPRSRADSSAKRFIPKVDKNGPVPDYAPHLGSCWLWLGAQDGYGYGSFRGPHGRTVRAHRFSYERYVGPIPDGLVIDHLCRISLCVNPAHMEPVTNQVNSCRGLGGHLATECKKGHPFTDENTRITPRGHRRCRQCHREAELARYYAGKKTG